MKAKSEAENKSGFHPNILPLAACQLSFALWMAAETVVGGAIAMKGRQKLNGGSDFFFAVKMCFFMDGVQKNF